MARSIFYLFFLVIIITTQSFSQRNWVPFLKQEAFPPHISLLKSNSVNVNFRVITNGMFVTEKIYEGISYHRIRIPDCESIVDQGLPEMPIVSQLIAIPDCERINLEIDVIDSLLMENYHIIPAPKYFEENNYLIEEFIPDNDIYSLNAYFPGSLGKIVEQGKIREQGVIKVYIYPIQFNPVTKKLKVYTNLQVRLHFTSPQGAVIKGIGPFYKICRGIILNYK